MRVTKEFLTRHGFDLVVHGDDHDPSDLPDAIYGDCKDRVVILPRTEGVSSEQIRGEEKHGVAEKSGKEKSFSFHY